MPTYTKPAKVTTDSNGAYHRQEIFNPPGPDFFTIRVSLKAKLVSPADTTVICTLDVDAVDGKPQNDAQEFTFSTGEQISLGTWKLDGGNNRIVVSGQTSPSRADTEVEFEFEISF
jgi:hypothetical protein